MEVSIKFLYYVTTMTTTPIFGTNPSPVRFLVAPQKKKRSIWVSFLCLREYEPGFSAAFALSIIALQCSIPGGTTIKKRSSWVFFLCLREYEPGFSAARAQVWHSHSLRRIRSVDYCLSHFLSRKGNDYFGRNRRRNSKRHAVGRNACLIL